MAMNDSYLNLLGTYGGTQITHIGLVNGSGVEISGGTPAYARKSLASVGGWTAVSGGMIRPAANMTFDIPAGATVAGWRGYTAVTGGTEHGGAALTPEGPYGAQGTYTVLAALTGIDHNAA